MLLWEVPMVFPVDLELFYLLAKLHVALKAAHIILQMDSSPLFMAVIHGGHLWLPLMAINQGDH